MRIFRWLWLAPGSVVQVHGLGATFAAYNGRIGDILPFPPGETVDADVDGVPARLPVRLRPLAGGEGGEGAGSKAAIKVRPQNLVAVRDEGTVDMRLPSDL